MLIFIFESGKKLFFSYVNITKLIIYFQMKNLNFIYNNLSIIINFWLIYFRKNRSTHI